MSENLPAVIALDHDLLIPSKYSDEKHFAEIASGASFFPRVQLFGGNSNLCKKGKINVGTYGLVRSDKNEVEGLTAEFSCVVLGWRPRAMQIEDDNTVHTYYNPSSPDFKRVKDKADSGEKDTGCMYGPEFLMWLPSVNPSCFATFFCSNPTARREAPTLKAMIGRASTFKAVYIESKKFSWHGPKFVPCSAPMTIPPREEIVAALNKFNNPPETAEEKVDAETDADRN